MKFFLVTDNSDAKTGMRLAGINSAVVASPQECMEALKKATEDKSIGIILITQGLYGKCADAIDEIKKNVTIPLITEIPDNNGGFESDAITRYVVDAIGIG